MLSDRDIFSSLPEIFLLVKLLSGVMVFLLPCMGMVYNQRIIILFSLKYFISFSLNPFLSNNKSSYMYL